VVRRFASHGFGRVSALLLSHHGPRGQGRPMAGHEYFAPGFYLLNARIARVDDPPLEDGSDDHAFHMKILYGLTPSSDGKVIDFWACRAIFASVMTRWIVFLRICKVRRPRGC